MSSLSLRNVISSCPNSTTSPQTILTKTSNVKQIMERMMGVVCRFVGSKRSKTERYVISNCPVIKRSAVSRAVKAKKKGMMPVHSCFFCRTDAATRNGANDGSRTHNRSLGSYCFAAKLHSHVVLTLHYFFLRSGTFSTTKWSKSTDSTKSRGLNRVLLNST